MRFRLPQKVVYWAPATADSFGRPTLSAPVELAARWEDKVEQTIGQDGNLTFSAATVYLATNVLAGGVFLLGCLQDLGSGFPTNPKADPRTHEIIGTTAIPSLKNTQVLITAYLK